MICIRCVISRHIDTKIVANKVQMHQMEQVNYKIKLGSEFENKEYCGSWTGKVDS